MGYIAFGTFLLLLGGAMILAATPLLVLAGWVCVTMAAVLLVVHVAVGPRRGEAPPTR